MRVNIVARMCKSPGPSIMRRKGSKNAPNGRIPITRLLSSRSRVARSAVTTTMTRRRDERHDNRLDPKRKSYDS